MALFGSLTYLARAIMSRLPFLGLERRAALTPRMLLGGGITLAIFLGLFIQMAFFIVSLGDTFRHLGEKAQSEKVRRHCRNLGMTWRKSNRRLLITYTLWRHLGTVRFGPYCIASTLAFISPGTSSIISTVRDASSPITFYQCGGARDRIDLGESAFASDSIP